MIGAGGISRHFKNDYITLSEGDVINIKTNLNTIERLPPLNNGDINRIFKLNFNNFISNGLNFNFTFLIELDPLDN